MSTSTRNQTIPSSMESKLRTIQKRLFGRCLLHAFAIGASVLILLMVICMIIDWSLMLIDPIVRTSLTAGTLLAAAGALLWAGYRPLSRVIGWTAAAKRIDHETPLLEERWTTVLTFSESEAHPIDPTTRAMLKHVTSEAVAMGELVEPRKISSAVSPRKAVLTFAGCVVMCAGFLAADWAQTSILLKRFWNPTANITATQLESVTGDLTVPRGETAELKALLSGLPRDKALLTVKYDSGIQEILPLEANPDSPGQFLHSLRVNESFQYQVAAGDGRTAWHQVTAIDYPLLEEIRFKLIPPDYLNRETYEKSWIPSRVKVAHGSRLELVMKPDIPLERFHLKLTHLPENGDPVVETFVLKPGNHGSYLFELPLLDNLSIEPLLLSLNGLSNENRQVCRIEVIPDLAPIARVITPDDETAVANDDVVKIEFEAHDDHGIETAELIIYDESTRKEGKDPEVLEVRPIDLKDQAHQKHIMAQTELDLKELALEPGKQISIAVRVTDNRQLTAEERERMATLAGELKDALAQANQDQPQPKSAERNADSGDSEQSMDEQNMTPTAASEESDEDSKESSGKPIAAKSESPEKPEAEDNPTSIGDPTDRESPNSSAKNAIAQNEPTSDPNGKPEGDKTDLPGSKDKAVSATDEANEPMEHAPAVAQSSDAKSDTSKGSESDGEAADEKFASADKKDPEPSKGDLTNPTSGTPEAASNESSKPSDKKPMPGKDSENVAQSPPQEDKSAGTASANRSSDSSDPKDPKAAQESMVDSVPLDKVLAMSPQTSDTGQNVESNRRKLKITQRLASVTKRVQERKPTSKIRDRIVALDEQLAVVETGLQKVLKREIPDADRQEQFKRLDKDLSSSEEAIADIRDDTRDTQFAFVGLQMLELGRFHVTPARDCIFAAIQTPVGSDGNTSKSLHHIERARELLAALLKRYDAIAREDKLEDSLEETVKIYEIYVERTHQLMREARQNKHPLDRKMAVVEVDQTYLDRYAEVLTLRREMLAELARMLADDPRLASRYLDLIKRRRDTLLEQLRELSEQQEDLTTELSGWLAVDESQRKDLWTLIFEMRLQSADRLASDTAEFSEQMVKQLPLSLDVDRGTAAAALRFVQDAAQFAREISFETRKMYGASEEPSLEGVTRKTSQLLACLRQTERALDRLSFENDGPTDELGQENEVVEYASARLVELQVVSDQAFAWSRMLKHAVKREYPFIASGDQRRLGIATEQLRIGLLSMEDELQTQFQRAAGNTDEPVSLPVEVRELISELHRVMEGITLNQAAATYSLSVPELADAEQQQHKALEGFQKAEELFGKIRREVVKHLDEYDVDDPNIDDLQDPTLDEFLEQLEREPNIEARLGIPDRPNNLRIIADTMTWQMEGGNFLNESLNAARQRMQEAMKKKQEEKQTSGVKPEEDDKTPESAPDLEDLEEMLRRSVAKLEEQMKDEAMSEAERRKLEAMAENMRRFMNESRDQPSAEELWRKIAESDQAEALLKAMARGEAIPDEQWNKVLSTLNEGLWQIRGRTPPEEYRKSIEQYQDQLRKLIDADPSEPEPSSKSNERKSS